jgi:hypothetical protein
VTASQYIILNEFNLVSSPVSLIFVRVPAAVSVYPLSSSQVSQPRLASIKTTARAAAGPSSEPLPETHAPPPVSDSADLSFSSTPLQNNGP